ncbi:CDGSH iron-sulfur domain-containing protein [Nocardioides mangrovicus]|uniref:CDGSH iron-sulfur domain-containing protein n=1 Tax=Nocardioides mangrovicus TaxID=2478913 RepID=A0A3L8P0S8_9ACTN|nr:CDGSH iron-sulfur domain-containing protein [Nocardioides mangrovicus]RLV49046.1 CDGSH iron-sulfur domain-containing protein [Nocardioides mangrovicus]
MSAPDVSGDRVEVRACPRGPWLVRGATVVRDAAGVEHVPTRPVVAVCRCRKTSRGPWCDGTHKSIPGY